MTAAPTPIPAGTTGSSAVRRRLDGEFTLDEWGLDPALVHALSPVLGVRFAVDTQWAHRIPSSGPAVLVSNRQFGVSEPFVLARGVRLAAGRFVRTTGIPDVAPVGPVLRRLGGVLDRPDEVAGLLRAGHIVSLPLARHAGARRAGPCAVEPLAAARALGVAVVPVALVGHEWRRRWRVLVGEPVPAPEGAGPLAHHADAERVQHEVQELLHQAAGDGWPV